MMEPGVPQAARPVGRKRWWLRLAFLVAVLGNAAQALWIASADSVSYVTRDEMREQVERCVKESNGSLGPWCHAVVDLPDTVVLQFADTDNLRSLVLNESRMQLFIWTKR